MGKFTIEIGGLQYFILFFLVTVQEDLTENLPLVLLDLQNRLQRLEQKIGSYQDTFPEPKPEPQAEMLIPPGRAAIATLITPAEPSPEAAAAPQAGSPTLFKMMGRVKDCVKGKRCQKDEIIEGVCNSIVGEIWFKWDCLTQYYPSLVFLFLENGISYPKRAQIKVRWTGLSNSLNAPEFLTPSQEKIDALRIKIQALRNLSYVSGGRRFNYVSPHLCSWKTTIYAKDRLQVTRLLEAVLGSVGEDFADHALTSTSPRQRVRGIGREISEMKRENQMLSREVPLSLRRVVLQAQG